MKESLSIQALIGKTAIVDHTSAAVVFPPAASRWIFKSCGFIITHIAISCREDANEEPRCWRNGIFIAANLRGAEQAGFFGWG